MSDSNNSYLNILIEIPIFLHRYLGGILFVIGNLGNLVNLVIFFKRSWRKNVCVFYFIICQLSNIVFINSSLIGAVLTLGFQFSVHNSNQIICKLFYYVSYLFSCYYPTALICASFDRLLLSSQNVDTRLYSSKRLAYLFLGTSLLLWTVFLLHVLVKVNIQQLGVDQFMCTYDFSPSYLNFVMYSTLVLSILITLVLIILSILAFKNVRRIRANPAQTKRNQIRTMHKKDFQLLRCLYIHNIVYIIGSFAVPASICYTVMLDYARATPLQFVLNTFLNDMSTFIHYIPYCTSFFIFISVSKAFRQELKRMSYKLCGKNLVIIREEENQQQEAGRENINLDTLSLPHP